jgi:hypothetical protein
VVKGFSERNIKRMLAFYREYRAPAAIMPQAAAQMGFTSKVPQPVAQIRTAPKVTSWFVADEFVQETLTQAS